MPFVEATLGGVEGYQWSGMVFVPKVHDPTTDALTIFLAPPGGRSSVGAIAKGDNGLPPDLRNIIITEIEYDDEEDATGTWTQVSPGDEDTRPVYDLNLTLRKGEPGDEAAIALLDATDLNGDAAAGYTWTYASDADGEGNPGLVWTPPKNRPVLTANTISSTSGAGARTLATQSIPVQPVDWKPGVSATTIISGTVNTRPDLVVRQTDAAGVDVGRGFGVPSVAVQSISICSAFPTGSNNTTYGVIAAGAGPTVYVLRAEEQASTIDEFTTSASTTRFEIEVRPV